MGFPIQALKSGNKVCDYSENLKNLSVFHNPTLDRHNLLPHSSTMFEINVIDAEIKSVNAAPEYRNENTTIHIISKDVDGSANKIIVSGGYNRQLVLYSKHEFILTKCDLKPEYGGCRLKQMTPTTITESGKQCEKKFHLECDMLKHVRKEHQYRCPNCKNLDPETGKLKPEQKARKRGHK